jgi:serine/threonine protein kinase
MEKLFKKLIKSDKEKDPLKNKVLFKKYRIIEKLGKGSFGFVYSGVNIHDDKKIAIKLENRGVPYHLLEKEGMFLSLLKGPGIPEVFSYGKNKNYNILILELLGENLWQILKLAKLNKFSINDLSKIAIQIIDRLEYVHSKNILHRDIKPENFLMGLNNSNLIYIIDFGLCKRYRSSKTGKHILPKNIGTITGALKYISTNVLKGNQSSRRDDLISLGYMLIYLLKKELPWELSLKTVNDLNTANFQKLINLKETDGNGNLFKKLPPELVEYVKYTKSLKFEQEPDYSYLRSIFHNIIFKKNLTYKNQNLNFIKENQRNASLPKRKLSLFKSNFRNKIYNKIKENIAKKSKKEETNKIINSINLQFISSSQEFPNRNWIPNSLSS